MADRLDYFFRQKVTEAELDLGFALLEQADRDFANDIGVFGIIDGMIASERAGVPDLTVDLTAPGRAYDQLGQRIFFGTAQVVDVSTDLNGVSTAVQSAGNEKIVSLFVKFDRALSDPRTDGNSQQVFFRRDENFQFVIRQGAEAPAGTAVPPPLQADEVLVVDVTRTFGQTQILNSNLSPNPTVTGDVGRKQNFIFAEASAISVFSGGFTTLAPVTDDIQSTLQEIDDELTDHFGGAARRHSRVDIDATAVAGSPNSLNVGTSQSQAAEILGHLNDHENDAINAHAASAILAPTVGASPNSLGGTEVQTQLGELLTHQNNHLTDPTGAHAASAVSASGVTGSPNSLAGADVQAQHTELLNLQNAHLNDAVAAHAASAIGATPVGGSPNSTVGTDVQAQLSELLGHLNSHANAGTGAHPATAVAYASGPNWADGSGNPGTTVELQLDKIINDLANLLGASRIGAAAAAGSPNSLGGGTVRSQLDELLGFVNLAAITNVANTFTQTQTFNGDGTDADAAIQTTVNPGIRKLFWEGTGQSISMRIYYTDERFEFTVNARWNGTQWERDSTSFFASRLILARNAFELSHLATSVAQPFGDTEWSGALSKRFVWSITALSNGQNLTMARERTVPGPLTGFSAIEGEYSILTSIGAGSSFSSGKLPANPSSVTFTVVSQSGTDNTPSTFNSRPEGVGWFDGTTGAVPGLKRMTLTYSAT